MCSNGRLVLREQFAADALATALLDRPVFHEDASRVRDHADPVTRAHKLAGRYLRGTGRRLVAELLRRSAAAPDIGHAAPLLGARAYTVKDNGPRWVVVEDEHVEHVFFEDGEDEARELASQLGCDVVYRPGAPDRARHYSIGRAFVTPIAIGAHVVAARGAGQCLGWHSVEEEVRPCQSKAAINYRPYCGLHGGWDFRHKRGAWEVERERSVRMLVRLATPAVLDGVRAQRF